jgi:parallel beta-helix repeat protein
MCNGGIHTGRCKALVENNIWVSTGKTMNTDAIDVKGVVDGIVRGNRLYNFNGFNSDGIDLGEGCKNVLVEGNFIFGNRDKGISCGGASTCTVRNNIIVACDLGIGIKDEGSAAALDHNTFVRNRIGVAAYSKVFGRGGGSATVTNCIFSGSKASSFFKDATSSVTLSYCISDVDILPGTGNKFGDPHFTDLKNNMFQLQQSSPCINAGDPASPKDHDGSVTDIGAPYTFNAIDFPADKAAPFTPSVVINEIMSNDNKEFPSGDWVELYNPTKTDISIGNWKMCDKGDFSNWETTTGIADVDSEDVFVIPANTVLKAGEYLVLCRSIDTFKDTYKNVSNCIGNLSFSLGARDTVYLYNDKDSLVNIVSYSSDSPWPNPDKGSSIGLRFADNLNWLPLNWAVSKVPTPGAANGLTPVIRGDLRTALPAYFFLNQNFPNPFRVKTTIQFALPVKQKVLVKIFNIAGRLMETPINNAELSAGVHAVILDGRKYPPGIYLYNIRTESFKQTRTMTIR